MNSNRVLRTLHPNAVEGGIFSKITGVLSNKVFLYSIGAIVALVIVYLIYRYISNKYKTGYKENSEHINVVEGNNGKDAEIMLFTVDWCPHCKTAKPEWDQVKTEYNGKVVNGYTMIFTEVNCTNESPEIEKMMDRFKIEGYPTIKLLKDGQVIEFDAKPVKSTLIQFINTVV